MSLIFSALAEMEKQAPSAPAYAASAPFVAARQRREIPILVGAFIALGLGAFVAVKSLSPAEAQVSDAASTTAAPQAAGHAQPAQDGQGAMAEAPARMAASAQSLASVPAAPGAGSNASEVAEPAPYLAVAQPANEVMAITNQAPAPMPVSFSRRGDDAQSAAQAAAAVGVAEVAPPPAPAVANVPAVALEQPPTATASPQQSVPAQRQREAGRTETRPDQAYLDDNTYIRVGKQPEPAADHDVGRLVANFNNAMATDSHDEARAVLGKLKASLSPESLTLLRMQAWYAVDAHEDGSARGLYARILDRVPDDENAGVNLALIDWRAGRHDVAQARINQLHMRFPDSPLVSRSWQMMNDGRR